MIGTYIGEVEHLRGERAMLKYGHPGEIEARFNNSGLTLSGAPLADHKPHDALGFGWHAFPEEAFDVDGDCRDLDNLDDYLADDGEYC